MDVDRELPADLRESDRLAAFARRRREFADDPYRPDYHFVPPGGLLHDPNGALYRDGRYHLFYQFWPPDVPADRDWSEAMHWGHAVSDDLLHWTDLPVALSPDGGPEAGCYSGQALVEEDRDRVVLMYFGTEAGECIATAEGPLLTEIEKSPANPVIPLEDDAPYEVFDPCLWRDGDTYCALSGGSRNGRTAEFLFTAPDLTDWEYRGTLIEDGFHTEPGEDGAVPNFFPLDGRHVLLFFSHPRGPQYYVGDYDPDEETFAIGTHGRLNHGPVDHSNLHAPSVLDDGERRVAVFNVLEGLADWRSDPGTGWAGVMSLPRRLSLEDGDLRLEPVEELTALRADHRRSEDVALAANEEWHAPGGGRSIELRAEVDVAGARELELSVLRSADGTERTTVTYWPATDALGLTPGHAGEDADALGRPPEVGALSLERDEPLELRVFVDNSVVEVFANGRQTLTTRADPGSDSTGISLLARRGDARLEAIDVWEMESIWNDDAV